MTFASSFPGWFLRFGGSVAVLVVAALPFACAEDEHPKSPNSGTGASSSSGGKGSGGLGSGGLGGGDAFGGEAGSNGVGGGTGGSGLPTSCDGIECQFGACDGSSGVATCQCDAGFEQGDDLLCTDSDECFSNNSCGAGSTCVNLTGDYFCACDAGYAPTGAKSCSDVNECGKSPCHPSASCSNQGGGFTCTCSGGAYGDGLFCKATDACAGAPCGPGGTCVNTPSGYACQCGSGSSGRTSCAASCATISLSDPELEAALRETIGKANGAISASDVATLTYLDASGRDIDSLNGLACIPSLETLVLSGTSVDGAALEVVRELNRLRQLDISCTPVTNLDFLEEHPTLERLDVNSPSVLCPSALTDISAVTTVGSLKQLTLQGHGIASLAGFGKLKRLQVLYLSENQIGDIAPLAGIPGLQELYLGANELTSLSSASALTALRGLDVSGNPLANLTGLSSLTGLETLRLDNLGLTALPNLSALTHLRTISFAFNQVTSLEPLSPLSTLGWIYAQSNQVTTVAPLVGTGFRGTLVMSSNQLDCAVEKPHQDALIAQGAAFVGMTCL